MQRTFALVFILLAAGLAHGQGPITIGKTETLVSDILKEERRIQVYLPGSVSDTYFYPRRYPVVYLLDGDSHFWTVSAIIKQLSEDGGGLQFPEMIVVAIGNTDRIRDLTPTRDTTETGMGRGAGNHSGGGEQFLAFIEKELIPHIDSAYPTMPYRVFIGHSLGGLTVVNTLVHHPALFNGYIAIDPSMSWDRGRLLHETPAALSAGGHERNAPERGEARGKDIFLAAANSLQGGLDTVSVMSDSSNLFSRHMRAIFSLRDVLVAAASGGGSVSGSGAAVRDNSTGTGAHLRVGWKYYPQYNHGSVPVVAEYDGLRYLFDFYRLDIRHEDIVGSSAAGDTLFAAHYAGISRRMGYKVSPPEVFVNNIGYDLMGRRQYDRAFYFFELNRQNYPNSFNVYDSMGDFFLARGDKKRAMESYAQALALRDYPDTRKKLERLQAEK